MFFILNVIDDMISSNEIKNYLTLTEHKFDWMLFLELAKKHHMTAFLAQAFKEFKFDFIPSIIRAALDNQITENTLRNEKLSQELVSILLLLKQKNIIAIPFKGPTLVNQIYNNSASRFSRDIDILIQKKDISAALNIMEKNGYYYKKIKQNPKMEKAYLDYNGQYLMFSADGSVAIEPHTLLAQSMLSIHVDYDDLWNQLIDLDFGEHTFKVFRIETLFLILCVHGAKEEWTRLKWIVDIAQAIKKYPDMDFCYILQEAKKWGCLRMVYLAIGLAQRIFSISLPKNMSESIAKDAEIAPLITKVVNDIEEYEPNELQAGFISSFVFRTRENNKDKFLYLWRIIFTPTEKHYRMIKLPEILFFGYILVKVIHDYILLPVWLFKNKIMNLIK